MARRPLLIPRSFLNPGAWPQRSTVLAVSTLLLPHIVRARPPALSLSASRGKSWQHTCSAERQSLRNGTLASDSRYGGKPVIRVDQPLYDYMLAHTREPQVLCDLREETSSMAGSQMQISPDQGQFLAMLVRLIGAERCIEVGVYTGYSSLAVALALPDWGRLVACDRDTVSLNVAQKYYEQAGVAHKVDTRHGVAVDTLNELLEGGEASSYAFAFLDADKRNYSKYYELLLQLTRSRGLIAIDNVLWHGKVADLQDNEKRTQSLRNLNWFILHDDRVDISMVPIGDGMTLCRKREMVK